jgi:hypothetical protein
MVVAVGPVPATEQLAPSTFIVNTACAAELGTRFPFLSFSKATTVPEI